MTTVAPDSHLVVEAATRLRMAAETRVPCEPVRDMFDSVTAAAGYAVQEINSEMRVADGHHPVGWKIGLTSPAVQRQLGVDQPDFGRLFSEMSAVDGGPIRTDRLIQPKVEAEVAFVLDRDLPERPVTAADVIRATAFVLPALEIVDSRVVSWDITILDTVADNASTGMFVVGNRPRGLAALELRDMQMTLSRDGAVVSRGTGSACLGHPVNAVVWLANTLHSLGKVLSAGELVLSGALGPMQPVDGPTSFEAMIEGLGSVRARFEGGAAA